MQRQSQGRTAPSCCNSIGRRALVGLEYRGQRTQTLLAAARQVLERYLFDGDDIHDDVAELCMKIDDVMPPEIEAEADRRINVAA